MAGLMAARVLADAYGQVTVIERDVLPGGAVHRRGVPQSRHTHALLPSGLRLIEELFDGLTEELVAAGALIGDTTSTVQGMYSGHRLAQGFSGVNVLFVSRPLLESRIRARVRGIPVVAVLDGSSASGVVTEGDGRRVVGVRVIGGREPASERILAADLVVDATGRGSRTPAWLAGLGFTGPRRERVAADVRYASRLFRLRPGALGRNHALIVWGTPAQTRTGTLAAIEGGVHLCTLSGFLGDTPPTALPEFLAFARTLLFPDILDAIVDAVPLDDGATFGYPADVRLHYEELPQLPAGLLVIGDALCALNPVYGQGMTVAAMEAAALRRVLEEGPISERRYFNAAAAVIDVPWDTATAADLMKGSVRGLQGLRIRLLNSYVSLLHAAAAHDPELTVAFARVVGLIDPPSELLRPGRVARVLTGAMRSGRSSRCSQVATTGSTALPATRSAPAPSTSPTPGRRH